MIDAEGYTHESGALDVVPENWIAVVLVETGDVGYGPDERSALCAARTLREDAWVGGMRTVPTFRFYVNGALVREHKGAL